MSMNENLARHVCMDALKLLLHAVPGMKLEVDLPEMKANSDRWALYIHCDPSSGRGVFQLIEPALAEAMDDGKGSIN